jgi:hypothetical protein
MTDVGIRRQRKMVDIMVGVVNPVQSNQRRNSRHRQTLQKKKPNEKRKIKDGGRRLNSVDKVTISRNSGRRHFHS